VIDDAIVVVENIVMHRDAGQSRGESIRTALRESASRWLIHHHADRGLSPLISITASPGCLRALALTVPWLWSSLALPDLTPRQPLLLRKPCAAAPSIRALHGGVLRVYDAC